WLAEGREDARGGKGAVTGCVSSPRPTNPIDCKDFGRFGRTTSRREKYMSDTGGRCSALAGISFTRLFAQSKVLVYLTLSLDQSARSMARLSWDSFLQPISGFPDF